ncbi:MAG TPA: class I SAM-dependent methyltransferase [Candidatus Paceibacterota bacterium]|nr:class I SAM-dependent methyltransferase [Candidatus Paceibacterota bacterium]
MAQYDAWEREYRNSKLLTKDADPQKDTLRFIKFLKKDAGIRPERVRVLDIGSGTGRNGNHFASLGADVVGLEISDTAVRIARERAGKENVRAEYFKHDIGSPYPLDDESFDIAIDVTSSNSLLGSERDVYLREAHRVLKSDPDSGYFFVKTLCKDSDENAKALLKKSPGPEIDTYRMPELGLVERVWSRKDFEEFYGQLFEIIHLEKKESYTRLNNRSYKRMFWIAYMQKK